MDSLLQRISDLSPEELSRLAMQYKDENPSSLAAQAIPRRQQANNLPLSFSQQRLWFLDQLFPGLNAYNIPFKVRLKGSLRVGALAESLNVIIGRHEALRTRFATVNGQPVQVIDDQMQLSLPVVDFKAMPESDGLLYAERIAGEEGLRPFDLGTGPLMRAMVLRLTPEDHIVLITMHHIISDGWSMERFLGELTGLYAAYVTGNPIKLPELPIQYGDFAVWQRDRFQGDDLETYLSYWKEALGEEMPPLDLPTDRPRPPVQSFKGECQTLYLDESLTKALNVLSQRASATLFMTLLAAFKVLLYRYCGQNEILVGTPVAGRTRAELEPLIGFFVNTLVLRSDLSDDPGFLTLLGRVREAALGAYAHQDFPFEKLVEALQLERDLSRSPIFQVWFNLTNFSGELLDLSLPDLTVENFFTEGVQSKFDLTVYAEQKGESIKLDLVYSTDLFDADTMTEMLGHYEKLLESVVRDPNARVSTVGVGESERRLETMAQMIETPEEFKEMDEESTNQTIGARFEEQAGRYPERVAIATSEGEISYGELKERTNRIARQIRGEGARGRGQVALLLSHGTGAIAGIMGALKAGKTYVPLDGTYPRQRLKRMLEDSESTLIVTDEANRELAEELSAGRVAVIDIDNEEREESEEVEISEEAEAGDIAYILYTSGSTGEPKGVMQSHRNVLRHIRNYTNVYRISKEDRLTQVSSYGFDGAVMDIMGALMNGASLHPVNVREEGVRRVVEVIERERVTIYHSTPTVFRYLMSSLRGGEDLSSVRVVVMGGEEVYRKDWEQYRKHFSEECVFANGLGPSESTTGLIYMANKKSRIRGDSVPVGYAVEGAEVRLMDEKGRQAATRGEIAIVSEEVALGYWRKGKETSEVFKDEEGGNGRRMYLTGDLGRRRVDGSIEYLGRKDRQVKVRGYRVELGEIEAAMEEQEWVKEAVVVAREDERGEKRLIGYVVEEEGKEVKEEEVRRRVREKLPEYMVPVTVMKIREAPLTPNGKIDHRALPEPPKLDDETGGRLVGTRSPIGEVLTGIWTDMLKHDAIDIDSNFFDIGGHSLMAIQVTSRIKDVFEVDLPIRSFFEAPTVAGLSALIADAQKGAHNGKAPPLTRSSRDSEAPASFAQSRLWFLDQLEPGCPFYNLPLAVRVGGRLDVRVLRESLNEIIKRHEVLRTTFAMVEGRPVQLIAETLAISVPVVDLSELHEQARENEARRLTAVEVSQAFDLSKGPLMRVCVIEFGPYDCEVIITMHHIVTDGWSQGIFVRELTRLYESIVAGRPPVLPELPVQYADFASWQHEWLHGPVLESQLSYWKRQLGGRLAVLELPTDHPRPLIQTFRGSRMSLVLSKELSEDLRGLSRREGVTLHMTMLAAFITLLYRYTGQEDILVGAPIANRNLVEVEGLIGFFVNTLVIRADLSKAPTFSDLLRQVRRVSLEAYTNQDLPLERLIEELQPERSLSYAPLFQVMFTFQNQPMGSIELDGLSLSPSQINNATAKFDLILNMWETERGFSGWLEYSTDLFESSTIARMLMHFERLLISIVTDSDSPLTELKMLSEEERILLEKPIEVDELDYSFLF